MSNTLLVDVPEPKYDVGMTVIALINHQPRYARVQEAYLEARYILTEDGIHTMGHLRWEYRVLVHADPIEYSEEMLIAERTIIVVVQSPYQRGEQS